MKVAVIYNKKEDAEGVINVFGMQNQETYNPKTVERVASALEQGGHNVRVIDGNINVIEQLTAFMPRVIQGETPGMVFNMAYGIQGVSRYTHIPSLLEMLGVPYVGSSPAGHGIALDKVTTKVMVEAAGLPTAPYWVFYNADQIPDDLPFPLITKPKMEAVSLGIQIIHDLPTLKKAITDLVEQFKQPILVEQFIPGREFAIGLLGNNDPEILPILEIDLGGDPFAIQSLEDKLKRPKEKICPARVSDELKQELGRLTRETFRVLGIYDFCRVDFRMDKDDNLYILELNSMASLGVTGSYVHAAKVGGYSYESMINRMLDVAVERYFGGQQIDQVAVGQTEDKTKKDPLKVRLRSYLRGNQATIEDFLSSMVDINSFVENIDGVNSLGRWIANKLAPLQFNRQVQTRAEVGNILYFSNHMDENNDILIIGNLDNSVDYEDFFPFQVERGRIYGTGVSLGKGGLAVMLAALQALRHTRSLKKIKCGILLISDECKGGRSSKSLVVEYSNKSKYVVGLSGAGLAGEVMTSCYGTMLYEVEIQRRQIQNKARFTLESGDPILYAAQKINGLKKMHSEEQGVFVSVTEVQSKGIKNHPSHHVTLAFLIRYRNPDDQKKLETQVLKLFEAGNQTPIRTHVSKPQHRKPFQENDNSLAFFEKVEKTAQSIEVRVKKTQDGTSTMLAHVPRGVPAIDGFGPVTGGVGTQNEFVVRDSLIDRSVLLSYLIFKTSKDFQS